MGRIPRSLEARQTGLAGSIGPGYPSGQLKSDPHVSMLWQARDAGVKELHRERIAR